MKDINKITKKDYEKMSNHDKFIYRVNCPIKVTVIEKGNGKITDEQQKTLKELENYAKSIKDAK